MNSKQIVQLAKKAAEDKQAKDPIILHLKEQTAFASYFLIAHGTSDRHVKSIAENVIDELAKFGERVWHKEGLLEGRWALLDFGDVVIHIFHYEARKFYNLERLWADI